MTRIYCSYEFSRSHVWLIDSVKHFVFGSVKIKRRWTEAPDQPEAALLLVLSWLSQTVLSYSIWDYNITTREQSDLVLQSDFISIKYVDVNAAVVTFYTPLEETTAPAAYIVIQLILLFLLLHNWFHQYTNPIWSNTITRQIYPLQLHVVLVLVAVQFVEG